MEKTIYIIRSVSGAGKTTLANTLEQSLPDLSCIICSADDFMVGEDDQYDFRPEKLGYCHTRCQHKFKKAVDEGFPHIIVSNTSTQFKDFKYYLEYGKEMGYQVFVMTLENYHGNNDVHQVPLMTLDRQEKNIRNSLKLR